MNIPSIFKSVGSGFNICQALVMLFTSTTVVLTSVGLTRSTILAKDINNKLDKLDKLDDLDGINKNIEKVSQGIKKLDDSSKVSMNGIEQRIKKIEESTKNKELTTLINDIKNDIENYKDSISKEIKTLDSNQVDTFAKMYKAITDKLSDLDTIKIQEQKINLLLRKTDEVQDNLVSIEKEINDRLVWVNRNTAALLDKFDSKLVWISRHLSTLIEKFDEMKEDIDQNTHLILSYDSDLTEIKDLISKTKESEQNNDFKLSLELLSDLIDRLSQNKEDEEELLTDEVKTNSETLIKVAEELKGMVNKFEELKDEVSTNSETLITVLDMVITRMYPNVNGAPQPYTRQASFFHAGKSEEGDRHSVVSTTTHGERGWRPIHICI